MSDRVRERASAVFPRVVEQRRDFHRHPELAYEEVRTSGKVVEWCRELGLSMRTGIGKTGVIATLPGSKPGRTIALRAVFQNEDTTLFPGLFARVRIPLGDPRPMLVIPPTAVGNDQQGDFVYVVNSANVVERRAIVKGPLTESGLAIRSGLGPDDRVIVNGLLNARVGEKVAPTRASAPASSPAPASGRKG